MKKTRIADNNDPCRSCHNSLQCLIWAKEGVKAKCAHAGYFKKHYVNGRKKLVGTEIFDENFDGNEGTA